MRKRDRFEDILERLVRQVAAMDSDAVYALCDEIRFADHPAARAGTGGQRRAALPWARRCGPEARHAAP
ncbi:MAG: hypothetical protein LC130_12595 [Bryobacterales bacterium]|nr:hypothetical protein [Bryobacterales bacterium]